MNTLKFLTLSLLFLLSTNCGQQPAGLPKIPGVDGPKFNLVDGKVLITLNLLKLNVNLGGQMIIPPTKNSSFEVFPNVIDGGTTLQFSLDPADIKGVEVAEDPNTLPDGRPLPGIPGGILPSLRVDTELFDTSFYFHPKLFGIYVPFNFDTRGYAAYYKIVIGGVDAGLMGIVASDENGKNSGVVLFLRMDALKQPALKKLLQISRENPHLMY